MKSLLQTINEGKESEFSLTKKKQKMSTRLRKLNEKKKFCSSKLNQRKKLKKCHMKICFRTHRACIG